MLTKSLFQESCPPDAAQGAWIDVIAPTAAEIDCLEREYGVPRSFITHSLDSRERPRIDEGREGTLVILRMPEPKGRHAGIPYTTSPLGFVLTGPRIITICPRENELIRLVRERLEKEGGLAQPFQVLLLSLDVMAERYLVYLDEIDEAIDKLEERLSTALRNQVVQELLKFQKGLVYFVTALRGNELVLDRLKKTPAFHVSGDDEGRLEDVLVEIRQAIEASEIMNEILSNLMDAFTSIIANNLNVVMKLLAAVGVIVSVPILIASLYGMNVPLPFAQDPRAFFGLLVASLLGSLALVWLFRRRDWL
jgi:magnesium transporter